MSTPTPTPYVTAFNFRCDGTTQVYYRQFSDGRREDTNQINYNSASCGYQTPYTQVFAASNPQGGSYNNAVQYPLLSASCIANPSSALVNQSVTWQVMTTGGSGSFNYRWSGDFINGQTDH
jgi:hypothetical protein